MGVKWKVMEGLMEWNECYEMLSLGGVGHGELCGDFWVNNIYNIKEQKKVTIYHKNVLTQEHHELSIQVFHGIEIIFALLV